LCGERLERNMDFLFSSIRHCFLRFHSDFSHFSCMARRLAGLPSAAAWSQHFNGLFVLVFFGAAKVVMRVGGSSQLDEIRIEIWIIGLGWDAMDCGGGDGLLIRMAKFCSS
jgi:hypothetical protein